MPAYLLKCFSLPTAENISKQQRFLNKTVHQNAQLACDFPAHRKTITQLNAYLFKGVRKVLLFEAVWNNSTTLIKRNSSELSLDINISKEEKHAVFHLRDLQVSHTDSYMCKIDVIDPPPYETKNRSNLIYVKGKIMKFVSNGSERHIIFINYKDAHI